MEIEMPHRNPAASWSPRLRDVGNAIAVRAGAGRHNGSSGDVLGLQDSEIARLNGDGVTEGLVHIAAPPAPIDTAHSGLPPPVPVPINGF